MVKSCYQLKSDYQTLAAGTILYDCLLPDYGVRSDNERLLNQPCSSVTQKRSGDYPFHIIPTNLLEPVSYQPLPNLTDEHVEATCKPGQGPSTCRYLGFGRSGWRCLKHTLLAYTLDDRVEKGDISALGDNCNGREPSA